MSSYSDDQVNGALLVCFLIGGFIGAAIHSVADSGDLERAYQKGFKVGQVEAACGRMHFQPKVKNTYWVKIKQKSSK